MYLKIASFLEGVVPVPVLKVVMTELPPAVAFVAGVSVTTGCRMTVECLDCSHRLLRWHNLEIICD
jgi:hypothetical protein